MSERKELRKARLALLGELNRLELNHCKLCPKRNSSYENCQPCEVYAKIRKIGDVMEGKVDMPKKSPEIEKRNRLIVEDLLAGMNKSIVAKRHNVSLQTVYNLKKQNEKLFRKQVDGVIREKEIERKARPAITVEVPKPVEQTVIEKVVADTGITYHSDEIIELKSKIESLESKLEYKSEKYDELKYEKQQLQDDHAELTKWHDAYKKENEELRAKASRIASDLDHLKKEHEKINLEELQRAYDDYLNEAEKCKRLKAQVSDLLNVDTMNALLMEQNLMFRRRLDDYVNGERL